MGEQITCNVAEENPSQISNFIVLAAKARIYRCKGTNPNIVLFKNEIDTNRKMEKYAAIKTGKLSKHVKK